MKFIIFNTKDYSQKILAIIISPLVKDIHNTSIRTYTIIYSPLSTNSKTHFLIKALPNSILLISSYFSHHHHFFNDGYY